MTYSDSVSDNAQVLWRTVRGVADFAGRSRRSEVIYYWIARILVGAVLDFAVETVATMYAALAFEIALQVVLTAPMFALFVRRLHDLGRSGWWVLLIGGLFALGQILPLLPILLDRPNLIISAPAMLFMVALFLLCVLPGAPGANRYGQNPRPIVA